MECFAVAFSASSFFLYATCPPGKLECWSLASFSWSEKVAYKTYFKVGRNEVLQEILNQSGIN